MQNSEQEQLRQALEQLALELGLKSVNRLFTEAGVNRTQWYKRITPGSGVSTNRKQLDNLLAGLDEMQLGITSGQRDNLYRAIGIHPSLLTGPVVDVPNSSLSQIPPTPGLTTLFKQPHETHDKVFTFLFCDLENSTLLWEQFPQQMPQVMQILGTLISSVVETEQGYVFKVMGDGYYAIFETPATALRAAITIQRNLKKQSWSIAETGQLKLRTGLHTGSVELVQEVAGGWDFLGRNLNRAARLLTLGHGSQILLSEPCAMLVQELLPKMPEILGLRDLGQYKLKGITEPARVFQLEVADLSSQFPPLQGSTFSVETARSKMDEVPLKALRLFLCHTSANRVAVQQLYQRLEADGFSPWLDIKGITAGQDWEYEIEKALYSADLVLFCLTKEFVTKALNPEEAIAREISISRRLTYDPAKGGRFWISIQLEPCDVPSELGLDRLQWVNLYEDDGYSKLLQALKMKAQQLYYLSRLPLPAAPLLGRTREIEEICAKFRQSQNQIKLLTITGPGGVGKTSLSQVVAALLLPDFPDGTHFIELANLSEPSQLVPAIANQILPSQESGSAEQNTLDNLKAFLADKRLLLVLDNFEQLIQARQTLADLLKASPGLRLLLSSRERVSLREEVEYRLKPLNLENLRSKSDKKRRSFTLENARQNPAVMLFIRQAQFYEPDFEVTENNIQAVVDICLLLEGLPLALEIAAARIRRYNPTEMLNRLKNSTNLNTTLVSSSSIYPERHRSLQISLDWSYNLLGENRRQLFVQLAVFFGGFTLSAAEAICQVEQDPELEGLDSLLDKSLVRSSVENGQRRFTILESIRQYAWEKLIEGGQAEQAKERHAYYYLTWVEKVETQLSTPQQGQVLAELEQEHANLRVALRWGLEGSVTAEKVELSLRIGAAIWRFWLMRGYLLEGRSWLEQALELAQPYNLPSAKAKAFKALGTLCVVLSDLHAARRYYESGLVLARELNDRVNIASLLNNLGIAAGQLGDYTASEEYSLESLALFRELNNPVAIGQLLNNLGLTARYQGNYNAARHYLEQSLEVQRKLNDTWGIANALSTLGDILLDLNEWDTARAYLQESLRSQQQLGDHMAIAYLLEFLGGLAAKEAKPEKAVRLVAAARIIRNETKAALSEAERSILESRLSQTRQALSISDWEREWQIGQNLGFEEVLELALQAD